MPESTKAESTAQQSQDTGKKPYARPSVTSEPIYETLALACMKLPGQGAVCNGSPSRS